MWATSRLGAALFVWGFVTVAIASGLLSARLSAQQVPTAAYYDFQLYPTARGGQATANIRLRPAASPFALSVTVDGHVVYDVRVEARGLRPSPDGVYIAWAAPPTLEGVEKIGVLGDDLTATGKVHFNKLIIFITESAGTDATNPFEDPILLRGTSRSGRIRSIFDHTDIVGDEP